MKILVFISKLHGGGAERLASIILDHLCNQHDVTAAVFDHGLRPEAAEESDFVEAFCKERGIPCLFHRKL